MYVIFFFKQKTAYEMRISDWSSDVCFSDLLAITQKRSPKVTAVMNQRDFEREHTCEEIDREREPIHLSVERDDEGLNQTRASPVPPACGGEEVIEHPRPNDDHQDRVRPQLQPFAVAVGHKLAFVGSTLAVSQRTAS